MKENNFKCVMTARAELIEKKLDELLSKIDADFSGLTEAARYSTLGGGKRIRGFLATEFARLGGESSEKALVYASAVEMIHAASLIHDDLPCMDDDDIRRGKPSAHIAYTEATALLAGDALMIYPYEVISAMDGVSAEEKLEAVRILSEASGMYGMIGGQQMDISGNVRTEEKLVKLQSLKTGRMIRAACLLGCIASGNFKGSKLYEAATVYADGIGLAFQIIDDLLDVTGDPKLLGKKVGMDEKNDTFTFAKLFSYEEAFDKATEYTAQACAALSQFESSEILIDLAKNLLMRNN
ncbi:MAG: polyprenyl synthetase family protein [Clostridia bacterium]|nr:polyprenyl synthetase family protein [Clostridia bacterium]